MNWLQLVSPIIDWTNGKIYLPNSVHTALLQGNWIEGHVKTGTMTVLGGQDQLQAIEDHAVQRQISVLKSPKFWRIAQMYENESISWTKSFKGRAKWGLLYNTTCNICKKLNSCRNHFKHIGPCKLYSIVNDEGEEVVTVKRINVNAKLPV